MNLSNEVKVTITVIAALIVAFIGFRIMNDIPIFRQSQKAFTYFERVDGLTTGAYVYVNGVKVGSVKGIDLVSKDSVRVTMYFDLGIDIPKNSVARLTSSGLLDGKVVVVEPGDSPENIEYEDTIEGVYSGGLMETLEDEGERLSNNVSESFDNLNQLLEQLNQTISEENRENVNSILSDLNSASDDVSMLLENKRQELETSITHANRFLANLDTVSTTNKSRVDSALVGMERTLAEIETLSRNLNETNTRLDSILSKVDRGEGTLGELVNNPSLYNNLDSLSAEMKTLIKNINEDPGKYMKHLRLIEVF